MIDLNELLNPADPQHWTFSEATGINDFGQIVGNAFYDADGPGGNPAVPRAFLLTLVPEPCTIALMASLAAFLICQRMSTRRFPTG